MNTKSKTQALRQVSNKWEWWWATRPLENAFPSPLNEFQAHPLLIYWDFGGDHAAFAYELVRRVNRKLNLRAYPALCDHEGDALGDLFSPGKSRSEDVVTYKCNPKAAQEFVPGCSQPSVWKLDVPNNTLKKVFLRFITQQRQRWGIRPRRTVGETNRVPPWNYCVVLDRFDLHGALPAGRDPKRIYNRARERGEHESDRFMSEVRHRRDLPHLSHLAFWPELSDKLLSQSMRL